MIKAHHPPAGLAFTAWKAGREGFGMDMAQPAGGRRWNKVVAVVAILFGVLTLKEGGSVLLDIGGARAAAGAFVPFVLWFNTAAGLAYVVAGAGLWRRAGWSAPLAAGIAAATALVFAALGLHIAAGGDFEIRTVAAMTLRTLVWVAIALAARRWRQEW